MDKNKNKFFGIVELESAIPEDGLVDIEMLRVGKFEHKVYGELDITSEMLDNMVDNFNNDIIGREVSFDWNHKAEKASAWLKEVKNEDGVLVGSVEFTDSGKKSVEDKEFGYFSVEFNDDYEDPESGKVFGPTITGGALTNRPFISKLKKIEFSLDSEESSLYRLEEDKKMPKDKIKRTPVTPDGNVKGDGNDNEKTLEELQEENEALEAKIKELEDKSSDGNEGDTKLQEFIEAQSSKLEEMNTKLENLESENKKLTEDNRKNKDRVRTKDIEILCENLLNTHGHHPSVVETAKEVMLNADTSATIKLSETVGEGDDAKTIEKDVTIVDAITKILEAIPESQRANYGEKSSSSDDKAALEEEEEKLLNAGIDGAFRKRGLKRLTAVK